MAQRVFSLRYAALKLAQAVEEMAAQLPSGLPIAVARGMEAYQRQLTSVIFLAGTAMSPTFNGPRRGEAAAGGAAAAAAAAAAGQQDEQVERLLLRLIPRPSPKSVFVDDVVAFTSPFAAPAEAAGSVMVRRVAATEGDELECDDPQEAPLRIPQGHCWVLADNAELAPPHVIDSRSFGPLPFTNILGRVAYSARSARDHGPVENSIQGLVADAPVLEAEFQLDEFLQGGEGEEGGPGAREQ